MANILMEQDAFLSDCTFSSLYATNYFENENDIPR